MTGIKFVKQKAGLCSSEYNMTFSENLTVNDLTDTTLPNSEPGGYTFDFTIDATFMNANLSGKRHPNFSNFLLYLFGSSTDSDAINYKTYKNDVLQTSGIHYVGWNEYWNTLFLFKNGVSIGDKFSIKLWTNSASTTTYKVNAYSIVPFGASSDVMMKDMTWTVSDTQLPSATSTKTTLVPSGGSLMGYSGSWLTNTTAPSTTVVMPKYAIGVSDQFYTDYPRAFVPFWGFYLPGTFAYLPDPTDSVWSRIFTGTIDRLVYTVFTHSPLNIRFREVLGVKR